MKDQLIWLGLLMGLLIAAGCSTITSGTSETPAAREEDVPAFAPGPPIQTPMPPPPTPTPSPELPAATLPPEDAGALADVISVEASGEPGAYRLAVGIRSPDTGCDQYADWWEVVGEGGELIYRRVLLHSHVDEQPFVRSGGPVDVGADAVIWVRAHMNVGGYGGAAFKGSVREGFQQAELAPGFAAGLADEPPLPDRCAF